MYRQTTNGVTVTVEPYYLEDQSDPMEGRYVWAYEVRIDNESGETVRLLQRHWRIINAAGHTQEVRGAGVVGEQPVLAPGERFEYVSGTPLTTPSGIMSGSYQMENGQGELFDAAIPPFSLDSPHENAAVN